jgi:hypothetical protein
MWKILGGLVAVASAKHVAPAATVQVNVNVKAPNGPEIAPNFVG